MECNICTCSFNKGTRTKVVCGQCEFEACKTCIRTYLVTSNTGANPKCMNCAATLSLKFLVTNLNRSWALSGKYKETRTLALLDAELGKIPNTIQAAEAERHKRDLVNETAEFRNHLKRLDEERALYSNAIVANQYLMQGRDVPEYYRSSLVTSKPVKYGGEKKKFIMACPGEECKGFLSTGYKCGICEKFSCKDCLILLGKTKGLNGWMVASTPVRSQINPLRNSSGRKRRGVQAAVNESIRLAVVIRCSVPRVIVPSVGRQGVLKQGLFIILTFTRYSDRVERLCETWEMCHVEGCPMRDVPFVFFID